MNDPILTIRVSKKESSTLRSWQQWARDHNYRIFDYGSYFEIHMSKRRK